MLNVMVSPSRKYIVTTKFTIDKEKENDNWCTKKKIWSRDCCC
jgi:hypothetical protein